MPFQPLRGNRIKLQHPVFCGTMPALANVSNLNASIRTAMVIAHSLGGKPD